MLEQEITQALSTPGMIEATQYAAGGYALKKLYDDLASPTVKQMGLLGAKIFSSLAIGIDVWAEKRKKRFIDLQNDLADNLKSKNPEDITENPPDYILAPAMASYMASIDKKELREMYAKLMAKALLKSYENKIHPAFATMIQTLHPDECLILHYFSLKPELPIISTLSEQPDKSGYHFSLTDIYLYPVSIITSPAGSIEITSFHDFVTGNPMYLSNLSRLGLIDKTYDVSFTDTAIYAPLINLPIVQNDKTQCESSPYSFSIRRGIIRLTPLGREFTNICLEDIE